MATGTYTGNYSLWIYNSAGEHIKTLDNRELTQPIRSSYSWEGTNKYGDKCASGVYVIYLALPYERRLARVLLIR